MSLFRPSGCRSGAAPRRDELEKHVGVYLGPWGRRRRCASSCSLARCAESQGVRRYVLASGGEAALVRLLKGLGPVSLASLLATLVLLFGFQGEQILAQPLVIAMLAVPILIQVYFNAGFAYLLSRQSRRATLRGGALRVDRREQFLRACGRGRD